MQWSSSSAYRSQHSPRILRLLRLWARPCLAPKSSTGLGLQARVATNAHPWHGLRGGLTSVPYGTGTVNGYRFFGDYFCRAFSCRTYACATSHSSTSCHERTRWLPDPLLPAQVAPSRGARPDQASRCHGEPQLPNNGATAAGEAPRSVGGQEDMGYEGAQPGPEVPPGFATTLVWEGNQGSDSMCLVVSPCHC